MNPVFFHSPRAVCQNVFLVTEKAFPEKRHRLYQIICYHLLIPVRELSSENHMFYVCFKSVLCANEN